MLSAILTRVSADTLVRSPPVSMVNCLIWFQLFDKSCWPKYQEFNTTDVMSARARRAITCISYIPLYNQNRRCYGSSSENALTSCGVLGQVGQVPNLPHKISNHLPHPSSFHFPSFTVPQGGLLYKDNPSTAEAGADLSHTYLSQRYHTFEQCQSNLETSKQNY